MAGDKETMLTDQDPGETPTERRNEKRGPSLVVISIFIGAILLLIALLFFAY